jgi:hypothetical protein
LALLLKRLELFALAQVAETTMATESKHHARKSLSRLRNLVMPSKGKVPKVISPAPSPPVHDPNDRISLAISGEFGTPNKKHTDPQSSCLFLTVLPPELRQLIYTHVFVPTGNPQMHVGYYGSKPTAEYTTYICRRTITGGLTREYPSWSIDPSYDKYTPGYWERSLALSMTCREVQVLPPFKSDLNLSLEHWSLTAGRYTETIQLMYNTGTFVFEQRSIRPF